MYSHFNGAEWSHFSHLLKVHAWLSVWIVPLISKGVFISLMRGTLGKGTLNQSWSRTQSLSRLRTGTSHHVPTYLWHLSRLSWKGDQAAVSRSQTQQSNLQWAARQMQCSFRQTNITLTGGMYMLTHPHTTSLYKTSKCTKLCKTSQLNKYQYEKNNCNILHVIHSATQELLVRFRNSSNMINLRLYLWNTVSMFRAGLFCF